METVEWKTLDVQRGIRVTKKDLAECGDYPVYQNSMIPLGYYDKFNRDARKTFVICAGSAGEIGFCDTPFWSADDCFTVCGDGLEDKFIYYYLLTQQNRIKSHVRKGGAPRLSPDVLRKVQIPVPPLSVQRSIVEKLDACTGLVGEIGKELELRKKQYEHCREKLLQIEGGEWKTITDCFKKVRVPCHLKASDFQESGIYPVVSQEKNLINGYADDESCVVKLDSPVVVFGDHTRIVKYVDFDFIAGADGTQVLKAVDAIDNKYLYYAFDNIRLKDLGYSRHFKLLKDIKIPVPSLSVQRSIVEKLDAFEGLIGELERELALREQQYEHLREKLLAFA